MYTKKQPKYTTKYPFLNIYQPKQSLNDPSFHFYTQPQPGFHKISLHRKSIKKPITMYYQQYDKIDVCDKKQIQKTTDNSTVIDYQYFSTRENIISQNTVVDGNKMVRESQWVKKYQPTKFYELLTDDRINRNLLTWLKAWDPIIHHKNNHKKSTPIIFNRNLTNITKIQNQMQTQTQTQTNYYDNIFRNPKKLILLAGPPGCGKTTLVRVLANHCKYNIIQINASDDRSANNLISKIQDIAGNDTIRGNKKPALICLDEIDGVAEGQASGIGKILDFIENGKKGKNQENNNPEKNGNKNMKEKSKTNIQPPQNKNKSQKPNSFKDKANTSSIHLNRPVIFICNDPFAKSLKQLRKKAQVVYFSQLLQQRVVKRMREILQKQKIHIQSQVLQKIAQMCKNDIRSCIGILELVARQKKINNKNPKDIVSRMKLSFTRDNQSSINQFLLQIFSKSAQKNYQHKYNYTSSSINFIKYIQNQVMQIYNPSLLMQTFLQNLLNVQGITRKGKLFLNLCDDLCASDILMRNGFKYQNQLENYHMLPYLRFVFNFGSEDIRRIQFPSAFFERLKKHKWNKQILKTIYNNIPLQLKIFMEKQSLVSSYLLALYLGMQTSSTKQSQLIRCVSLMLTYGFTLRKQSYTGPLFYPQIDTLLTFGTKKPQILINNMIKGLIEQNYQFFKERKQIFSSDHQLRDNTSAMLNQMHLNSRKKRMHDITEGLKYRYVEGTGTKTIYNLTMSFFF